MRRRVRRAARSPLAAPGQPPGPPPHKRPAAAARSASAAAGQLPRRPPRAQPPADWISALPLTVRIRMSRIKPATRQQYQYALDHFARWLTAAGEDQKADADALDAQLEAFAEHLFESAAGGRRQTAACARLACIWISPSLKHKLPRSLAITNATAWNRAAGRVTRSHPPIPWPLVCVVAHRLAAAGDQGVATAVVLAFDALLRVSEVASLQLQDVADQKGVDARLNDGVVVSIRNPKTADPTRGEQQSVTVHDPVVLALLRDYLALRRTAARPNDSLFGRTKNDLERAFTGAAAALGGTTRFTWHSLRHGGATYMSMAGTPVEDICIRGRWRSLDGVRRYIQTGRAVVAAHGVPPEITAQGEAVADGLRRACTGGGQLPA